MSAEGWYWPSNARKAHYYRRARSLCGRYALIGPEQLDGDGVGPASGSPDDCVECARRKRREAPAAGGAL